MQKPGFQELFLRWCENQTTEEEDLELAAYFKRGDADKELTPVMRLNWENNIRDNTLEVSDSINMADRIIEKAAFDKPAGKTYHRIHFLRTAWFRYAAALILITTGIALYNIISVRKENIPVVTAAKTNDILPGNDRAILTLSDGRKVELSNATSETITDGNLSIENSGGQLIYKNQDVAAINTMTTPKGGQYLLVLADGTRAWLNAASSITYPVSFTGKTREVNITGEVYFEVTENAPQPFIVKTYSDEIIVLGTSFNVNSYRDEEYVKTSLFTGSVKINNNILKPGQAFSNGSITRTNIDQDIAWKNGVFNFNDQQLSQVMRQLSRWYDIEVIYENGSPDIEFIGQMSRKLSLSKVLEFLKGSKVKFRMEGKKLVIMK